MNDHDDAQTPDYLGAMAALDRVVRPRDDDRDGISVLGVGLFLFGVVCVIVIILFGYGG